MLSVAEAKLGALFINDLEAVYLHQMLAEMGHKQPKTPIEMDNSMVEGIIDAT